MSLLNASGAELPFAFAESLPILSLPHASDVWSSSQYQAHISLILLMGLFHRLGLWQPSSSFKTSKTFHNKHSEFEQNLANRMWWHYTWIYIGVFINLLLTTSIYTFTPLPISSTTTKLVLSIQLLSTTMTTLSSILRVVSISGLGCMFTYNITLTQNHKLVTTGPYAWVRHPGYTGLFGIMFWAGVGHWGCMLGGYTYLYYRLSSSSLTSSSSFGLFLISAYLAITSVFLLWSKFMFYVFHQLHTRSFDEDKLMEKEFDREWKEWSGKVRWRYLTWIY